METEKRPAWTVGQTACTTATETAASAKATQTPETAEAPKTTGTARIPILLERQMNERAEGGATRPFHQGSFVGKQNRQGQYYEFFRL